MVGKYTGLPDAYKSLNEALVHGGIANRVKVNLEWIRSEVFERAPAPYLQGVHGSWCGGFGERGSEGKIRAATFATRQLPFFGICFGMQMACIEADRNLVGISGASSTEFGPTGEPVIGLMTEWMRGNELEQRRAGGDLGGTMRLGAYAAMLKPGSRVASIWRPADFRAAPPSLRGQHPLPRAPRSPRHHLLRHVARRPAARDHRDQRSPLVHQGTVPPRAQVTALRALLFRSFVGAAIDQSRLV